MIERLIAFTAKEEGFVPHCYDDATGEPIVPGYTLVGHPTIWWGLCIEKGRIPHLPAEMPQDARDYVIRRTAEKMFDRLPWLDELPESTQVGVCAMAYQLGVAGVMRFTSMIGALVIGDLAAAKAHALDSDWARNDTPARAKRVAALIANEVQDAAA